MSGENTVEVAVPEQCNLKAGYSVAKREHFGSRDPELDLQFVNNANVASSPLLY